jgi:hypothetical protein
MASKRDISCVVWNGLQLHVNFHGLIEDNYIKLLPLPLPIILLYPFSFQNDSAEANFCPLPPVLTHIWFDSAQNDNFKTTSL